MPEVTTGDFGKLRLTTNGAGITICTSAIPRPTSRKPPTAAQLAELGAADADPSATTTTTAATGDTTTTTGEPSGSTTTTAAAGDTDHDRRARSGPSADEGGRARRRASAPASARSPLSTPKQMLPVVNRPMIERVVEHLGRHGVDDGRARPRLPARRLRRRLPRRRAAPVWSSTTPSSPSRSTPPARSGSRPSTRASTSAFLVVNGDVLTDLDVGGPGRLPRRARGGGHDRPAPGRRPVRLRRRAHRRRRPCARPSSRSRRPGRRPTDLINAGTYVLEPSVLDRIPPDVRGQRRAGHLPGDGRRRRRSTPSTATPTGSTPARPPPTSAANLDLLDGPARASRRTACDPGATVRRRRSSGRPVAPGVTIDEGASCTGPCSSAVWSCGLGATVRRRRRRPRRHDRCGRPGDRRLHGHRRRRGRARWRHR